MLGLRFHPDVATIVDSSQPLTCSVNKPLALDANGLGEFSLKRPKDATCTYRINDASGSCELLDAHVGKMVRHEWACDMSKRRCAEGYRVFRQQLQIPGARLCGRQPERETHNQTIESD